MQSSFKRKAALFFSSVLLVAFGFLIGTSILPGAASALAAPVLLQVPAQPPPVDLNSLDLTDYERQLAGIFNTVSPSVVSINVTTRQTVGNVDEGFGYGSGSGFVLDRDGHIVTNNHVVDGATERGIEVNFYDGTIVRAEVVGLDPDADLAVLKVNIPPENLQPVVLGDSDLLVIGQTTLAIGSPFGQRWTLTSGIVSALDRTIQGLTNFSIGSVIQTDAAINPGNSGGPLFNLKGEVIGVNSQIISQSRSSSGVGFAVPVNLVRRVATDILANGRVDYSYLGINGGPDMSLNLIETLKLPNNLRGVIVSGVVPGGPAERAGLRNPGRTVFVEGDAVPTTADIITAINGVPLSGMNGLVSYLARNTRPGDTVNLTLWRDGQQIVVPVQLSSRPS
ncbi:MAG: trypsin-like peptidase domain-containing protein [Anaerolineae bacterium]|nr:trypsin-like peptidase domain-containing protein [Anaerolineae bacterium]